MMRLVLVLLCVAFVLLAVFGMRRGWTNRGRRQANLALPPPVPEQLGPPTAPSMTGLYVGTTYASSWQDRIVHGRLGVRADADATVSADGVLIERSGADPVFIPAAAISGVRLAPGLAGKVVGEGGLLVVRWRLGDAEVDTGLRGDDRSLYPAWVHAIDEIVATTVRSGR